MADNIKVAVRVRPLLQKEMSSGLSMLWSVKDNSISAIDSQSSSDSYVFDSVYDHMDTNEELYEQLCSTIIKSAMAGFHGTIFAYGQSGSGKTHTMTGSNMHAGVIDQAVDEMFEIIERESLEKEFLLRISYMEIYTERIFDLFDDADKTLKIQEDINHQISVVNLTEQIVNSKKQLLQWMVRGETKRKFAETKANDRSSRSHVILRIIIESRLKGDMDSVMVSHLNFVDLAGSEKAADNSGDRFREGCAINRSLLTLSQVISKLSEGVSNSYIGYRDSKLTRILQNALGGNSNTLIICTISPASMEESHSTLRFASRAKTIKNKPVINEVLSDSALLKKYALQIKKLQKLVDETGVTDIKLEKEDLEKKLQEKEAYQKEQEELINKLRTMLVVSATKKESNGEAKQKKQRRETWCGPKLRKSSAFHDTLFLPRQPLNLLSPNRHRSFPALEEEEDLTFVEAPIPAQLMEDDDSIFAAPDNVRKSFVTNSRRSGRRSEPDRFGKVNKEVEKLKSENEDLQEVNTKLGKRVMELESCNEKLEKDMVFVMEKLDEVMEERVQLSMQLDKETRLNHHEVSFRELQEFHRMEKELLEDEIQSLSKKTADLEGMMVPADAQYVKQLEQELASNYDKVVDLNKTVKEMEAEITKLKKDLELSKGEVDRKLRTNDDYIMMLEKQVNTSQEKLKGYERLSVGAIPAGAQMNSTLEATIESLKKDKANLEMMLETKITEVNEIAEEKTKLRASLDSKITEIENLSEERKSLVLTAENQASDTDALSLLKSKVDDLLKEKAQDAEKYEEEKQMFEELLGEKNSELEALVDKFQTVTVETSRQADLIDEMKALNEKIVDERNDMEKQLLGAKQELETMLAEKMEMEDSVRDVERVVKDKAALEEEVKEKLKDIEALVAEKELLTKSVEANVFDRSKRMSQTDVSQCIDGDVTVSDFELSVKMSMSRGPISLAEELSAASKPISLADELSAVSQPMSLADELSVVSQPMSHASELEQVPKPHTNFVSNAHESTDTSNAISSEDNKTAEECEVQAERKTRDEELQTSFEIQNGLSSNFEEQLKSKSEEIEKALKDIQNLEIQLNLKESEVESLKGTKSKLEQELEEKQEELETFSNEMMRLQDLVDEAQEKRISTEQDIREQKEALEDEKMKTRKLQEELNKRTSESVVSEHSGGVDIVGKEEVESLKKEIAQKMEEHLETLKEKDDLCKKIEELQITLEKELAEKEENKSLSLRVQELENSIVSKEDELEEMKKQCGQKEEEILLLKKSSEQQLVGKEEPQVEVLLMKVKELEETVSNQTILLEQLQKELEEREALLKELQLSSQNQGEEEEISFVAKETVIQDISESQQISEINKQTEINKHTESQENCDDEVTFATRDSSVHEASDKKISDKCEEQVVSSAADDLQTKVMELETTVMEKEAKLEQVKSEYEEQENTIKILQQSVEESNLQLSDLQANIRNLEVSVCEKESDIEQLRAEKEEQLNKVTELQQLLKENKENAMNENDTEVNNLLEKIQKLETTIQIKEEEMKKPRDELLQYKERVHSLTDKLETSFTATESKEAEIKKLVQKIESLETDITQRESDVQTASKVKDELCEELQKCQEDLQIKEAEINKLTSKIDHLESCMAEKDVQDLEASNQMKIKLDTVMNEMAIKEEQVKELSCQIRKLESDLEEKDLDVEAKSKQIEDMIEEIAQGKVEVEAKVKEAALLEERVAEVEEQLNQQETEFENIKEAGMAKINTLTEDFMDLQDRNTDLENCLKEKESELKEIVDHVHKLIEDEMQESNLQLQAKESELKTLNEKVSALEDALKEKDREIESVLSEKLKLEEGGEEMVRLVQEKHDLEEKLREKTDEVVTLLEEKSQIQLDLNHKTSELQVLVDYKNKQDSELEEKITEIESLSNEVLRLEDAVVEKTQELDLLQEEKTSTESLLKEKSNLLEDLGQKMNEFENLYQEKSDEVDACRLEIETLGKALTDQEEQLQNFRNDKSSEEKFQKEMEALHQIQKAKDAEIAKLKHEIEELNNRSLNAMNVSSGNMQPVKDDEAAKQKVLLTQLFTKLVKSGKSDLKEMIDTLEKGGHIVLANKLREQDCKLAKEKLEVDRKIAILESELAKKGKELEKKENVVEDLCKSMREDEDKIAKLEDEVETVKESMKQTELSKTEMNLELHYLRNKIKEEQKNHTERKAALEEEIEYKCEIIARLKGEVRKLQQNGDVSFAAPPQPQPEPVDQVPEVSSRSGIIDHYKVCVLEGEKKELQSRIRELRKTIQKLYMEVKELKEQNAELRMTKPADNKENGPITPKNVKPEKGKEKTPESPFNLDFLKKRRSLTYEDVKKMAAQNKEKRSTALSPIKDSSIVNEMQSAAPSMLGSRRLTQRKSLSRENTEIAENCKVQ